MDRNWEAASSRNLPTTQSETDPGHPGYIREKYTSWQEDLWGQKRTEYFHYASSDPMDESPDAVSLQGPMSGINDQPYDEAGGFPPSPLSDGPAFSERSTSDSCPSTPINSCLSTPSLDHRSCTPPSENDQDQVGETSVGPESYFDTHSKLSHPAPEVPRRVMRRILNSLSHSSCLAMRLTCKNWKRTVDQALPLGLGAANLAPPEVLFEIFKLLSPRDFDNARRTCSKWMRVSLNKGLLEFMVKRAGWWDTWQQDCQKGLPGIDYRNESLLWRLSKRFATECLLSGRKVNVERSGFLLATTVDFSQLRRQALPPLSAMGSQELSTAASGQVALRDPSTASAVKFVASSCGGYLLVFTTSVICTYRLNNRITRPATSATVELPLYGHNEIELLTRTVCPQEVLTATIDTTDGKLVIAALLQGRTGFICDLSEGDPTRPTGEYFSTRYIYDICRVDDPPKSVSICPGRRCFAFGCNSGVEIHWTNEITGVDSMKFIPMSQPSEILHFLCNRPGVEEEEEDLSLRMVSSLAGPGVFGCECAPAMYGENMTECPIHQPPPLANSVSRTVLRKTARLSYMKSTYCHHYHAKPVSDGLHITFIEPKSGLLCVGSDAPIGGPTSLTRALICVPPFANDINDCWKDQVVPSVFASGADLRWGLRIVAAYNDRIVLYSVPLDVFNVIRKERERQGDNVMGDSDLARDFFLGANRDKKRRGSLAQNQNGDWDFLLSVSYRPTSMMWPLKIYGKEIGRMDNLVELSLQTTNGGARIFAFGGTGEGRIFDIDTFSSSTRPLAEVDVLSMSVGSDGTMESVRMVDRAAVHARARTSFSGSGPPARQNSRKRKQPYNDLLGPAPHGLGLFNSTPLRNDFEGYPGDFKSSSPPRSQFGVASSLDNHRRRRSSFAACIVNFKIPDFGAKDMSLE